MATEWYCSIQGNEYGPLSPRQVVSLARSGGLSPVDLVRKGRDGAWRPAAEVKGLKFPSRSRGKPRQQWYCRIGERIVGPLSSEQLRKAACHGKISPGDLVCPEVRGNWVRAKRVRGLKFPCPPALPGSVAGPAGPAVVPEAERSEESSGVALGAAAFEPIESPGGRSVEEPAPWQEERSDTKREPGGRRWLRDRIEDRVGGAGLRAFGRLGKVARSLALAAVCIVPFLLPSVGPKIGGGAVLLLGVGSVLAGGAVFRATCQPDRTSRVWARFALVFTGVFGGLALLEFLDLVTMYSQSGAPWQYTPLVLLKALGDAYGRATAPPLACDLSGFLTALVSTIASVGLCEETLKLIPSAVAVGTGSISRRRGAMFIGAMSGLGFGLSEAYWVCFGTYVPNEVPLTVHLARLFGCANGHAAITLMASWFLFLGYTPDIARRPRARMRFVAWSMLCAVGAAVVHGSYNTLLGHGMSGLAGLTMAVVVWGVMLASENECEESRHGVDGS